MKKQGRGILCILSTALLCGILAGCSVPEYQKGDCTDTGWSSQWLQMTYTLPDNMTMLDEKALEGNDNRHGSVYEMAANSPDCTIAIFTEPKNQKSNEGYLKGVQDQMEALMPGQCLFGEIEKCTIAGQAFYAMDVVLQQSDGEETKTVYQTYLTMTKGDRQIQIVLSALDQKQMEMMMLGFSKIQE